jgi:sn-glycerol 3-phosphate transport system ATP-binding protein
VPGTFGPGPPARAVARSYGVTPGARPSSGAAGEDPGPATGASGPDPSVSDGPPSLVGEDLAIEGIRASSVELEGVSKRFGDVPAVVDLTLDARPGEFLVLLGPSGCGKSTVLRLVAGLETPTSGTIRIGGEPVNQVVTKDRDVAMVFQSYALYPHLNVRKNIEFPLRSRGVPREQIREVVPRVAKSLQLEALLGRKPAELSGGQRQRVALARALVRRPKAFLMDEPLSNLDAQLRVEMRAELVELHSRLGITIMYVTHDQIEAMTMGERIAIMKDGVLQQLDVPGAVRDRPANAFVAAFVGSPPMNVLAATVVADDDRLVAKVSGGRLPLPPAAAALTREGGLSQVLVGVRPEDLSLDPGGTVRGTISLVESMGRIEHLTCRLADGHLVNVQGRPGGTVARVGDTVSLSLSGPVHLFDPVTQRRLGP